MSENKLASIVLTEVRAVADLRAAAAMYPDDARISLVVEIGGDLYLRTFALIDHAPLESQDLFMPPDLEKRLKNRSKA